MIVLCAIVVALVVLFFLIAAIGHLDRIATALERQADSYAEYVSDPFGAQPSPIEETVRP